MKLPATLFVFFVFCFSFAARDAQARNNWPACPENGRNVEVYFEKSMGKLRYHYGYSNAQLARVSASYGRRISPFWMPLGLTLSKLAYETKYNFGYYDLGRGRYCAILKSVNVTFGLGDITVYVTNKYRRGSCEFESVLDHENKHVMIYRDGIYRHGPTVERKIRSVAKTIGPAYFRSPQQAINHLQGRMEAVISPMFKRMNRELDKQQARLDTKENYRREQAMCANW